MRGEVWLTQGKGIGTFPCISRTFAGVGWQEGSQYWSNEVLLWFCSWASVSRSRVKVALGDLPCKTSFANKRNGVTVSLNNVGCRKPQVYGKKEDNSLLHFVRTELNRLLCVSELWTHRLLTGETLFVCHCQGRMWCATLYSSSGKVRFSSKSLFFRLGSRLNLLICINPDPSSVQQVNLFRAFHQCHQTINFHCFSYNP